MNDKIPRPIDDGDAAPDPTMPTAREAWHRSGIMSEFAGATERMIPIRPAVSPSGSAYPC